MEYAFKRFIKGDRVIWTVLLLLSLFSILIIYSSTGALAYRVAGGATLKYLIRQGVFLAFGFGIILFMVHVIPVKLYAIISHFLVYISIGLLLFAFVQKLMGHSGDSSGRTVYLGFFSFQPAEIAKIALIMFTARILGKNQKSKEELKKAFFQIIIYTAVICGIIFLSDFSTSALLFATIMAMMFVGRIHWKYLSMVVLTGVGLVLIIYFTADHLPSQLARVGTIKGRLERFIHGDPNSEQGITQADYAKLAVYEGGLFGKGPGKSDVSNYMASAYNDFIFAIIVEEYGLIIAGLIILLYMIFFYRSVVIIMRTSRTFPAFLVTGLSLLLVFQAMINIGVSAGIMPVTGQPLPWVSMGGTSMIFTSVAFGCIISVSYYNQKNKQMKELQPVQVNTPDEDVVMK
ncbi:MAG: FtsW/RodA/SpoVE family cell cycle protein [Prolixibacteraceae bacterium]|nr:FtsW/RodA/SpoVE family cell cycle protein [Prolixibacteraceae bacterium]MBN2773745.1 FtsW/RodA/SpoVE family cell cycle protein [Prolixibacteraceae bacterium]